MNLANAFTNRPALMPFLMSGHPTPDAFARNLEAAAEFADVIEVGVPFSDPIADGPVIQAAAATALKHGTTLASTLGVLAARKSETPVVLMLSFNQVLVAGPENFVRRAADARVSGAIIPDLPYEEATELRDVFTRQGLALIPMLAPTTAPDRAAAILAHATGFVYLISVAGVTGAREGLAPGLREYVTRARAQSPVPVCVGFGISKPAHIIELRDHADGFIVGSALIRAIDEGREVAEVLQPLREATLTTGAQS